MTNSWGIPLEVENFVIERDKSCVYCGQGFSVDKLSRKNKASWEHIVNDIRINGVDNIALCCISCNASKGAKSLENWLKSDYCKRNSINRENVAPIVKEALAAISKREETK